MKKIPTSPHPPNPQTNNPNTMTTLRTDTDHWPHQLQNSVPRDNNKHRDLLVMVTFMNPYLAKVVMSMTTWNIYIVTFHHYFSPL